MRDCDGAIQLFIELQDLWSEAEMKACKWLGNSLEVLSAIPQERRALETNLNHDTLQVTNTLGILWYAQECFLFFVPTSALGSILTKRFIVGKVAKIFDPLGLVSLFVVQAKILIQDLWTMGVGWDDPVTQRDHYASPTMVF